MDKLQTGARYTSSANPGPTYLIVKLTPTRVTVTFVWMTSPSTPRKVDVLFALCCASSTSFCAKAT